MAQNREQEMPEKTPEELEELRRRTDETMAKARKDVDRAVETMAKARKDVDRAVETSHDQILPAARGIEVEDFEQEGVSDKEDTRGAWPNWTKDESGEHDEHGEHAKADKRQDEPGE